MKKSYFLLFLFLLTLLSPSIFSQKKEKNIQQQTVDLNPEKLSYLIVRPELTKSPDGSIKVARAFDSRGYWSKARKGSANINWKINAPKKEKYVVFALYQAPPNTEFKVVTTEETLVAKSNPEGTWQRTKLGEVMIPEGVSKLDFIAEKIEGDLQIKSLELLPSAEWGNYRKRVNEFREAGYKANFKDNVYGVMHHWGNWVVNPEGKKTKKFPDLFEDLDIEKWADMIQESGAGYVIWTTSWGEIYMGMPLKTVESIHPGRTTISYNGKNYFLEIAKALNKRGVKLILYFHHGQGDGKRHPGSTWWDKVHTELVTGAKPVADMSDRRAVSQSNYRAIIKEMGDLMGKRLYGWWFDDGSIDYPTDFHYFSTNARSGNPNRLIAINNSKLASYTDYQDYSAGEWIVAFKPEVLGEDGMLKSTRNLGLFPHGLVRAENHWAAYAKAPKIVEKELNKTNIPGAALRAAKTGYCMTFNVMMYEDGSIAKATLEGLKNAKKALEEAGVKRDFSPINQDLDD